VVLLTVIHVTRGGITETCIDCIGLVEAGNMDSCNMDGGTLSCGKYQIKQMYFTDCSAFSDQLANREWKECAFDDKCARLCIKEYMKRYQQLCIADLGSGITEKQLKCHDFGRLHNSGPFGCASTASCGYVERIKDNCYVKSGPSNPFAVKRPSSAKDC